MAENASYLTPGGKERFAAELDELRRVRRGEVEARLARAREHGDVTDNPEFDDAKNEQAFVLGRIGELERLLSSALTIDAPKERPAFVRLGCRVTVEGPEGEEEYHLVGAKEANPRQGFVSNESPVGRALVGKRAGEETTVVAPGGSFRLRVVAIA